jgi:N-acetylglucosaminyldiphosphoundecaprenol N-acetyl-beta-D-mannosaminyltransferase
MRENMAVAKVNVLGVPVQAHTMSSLLGALEERMSARECSTLYYVNAHSINLAMSHAPFMEALQRGDLVYADGASILLAAQLLGGRLPEKLTTTDVWPRVCTLAVERGYRFFLLGGEPGLAESAAGKACAAHPGLVVAGWHHGYFDLKDEEIVQAINRVQPDILWVGLGEPAQVYWAQANRHRLKVGAVITCGGLFKFIAGKVRRAPEHIHGKGLEWLYRIVHEPELWRRYARDLPILAVRVLEQCLSRKSKLS